MNLDVPGETELEAVTCSGEPWNVGGGYYLKQITPWLFFAKLLQKCCHQILVSSLFVFVRHCLLLLG